MVCIPKRSAFLPRTCTKAFRGPRSSPTALLFPVFPKADRGQHTKRTRNFGDKREDTEEEWGGVAFQRNLDLLSIFLYYVMTITHDSGLCRSIFQGVWYFLPIHVIFFLGMTKWLEFMGRNKETGGGVGVVGRREQKLNRHIIQMQTDQK